MTYRLFSILAVLGLIHAAGTPIARAQFNDLVTHLPEDANVLVLFNVEKMQDSPIAKKEGWREKHENAFASGMIILPPQATRFALAAKLDLETDQAAWDASVMDLEYEPSMPKVAAHHSGEVDEIGGLNTAVLPSDTYVVQWGKRLVGVMSPGNRQAVGRWIEQVYSTSKRESLSKYLQKAASYAESGTPVIMAMDLGHVMSAATIAERLKMFKSLQGQKVDLEKLSKALASIEGMTLGITINEQVYGKLIIDFGQDVTMTKEFAKPMLLEALANHGATINEFHDWEAKVSGTQISIEGPLYQSGRQRILSVIDAPPALQAQKSQSTAGGQQDQEKLGILASQQYFNTLKRLVDDLREQKKSGQTSGQVGMWYGKYARKIDSLPILNVDSDLVNFGGYVANQFRQAESAMKGIGASQAYRISTKQNAQVYNYHYSAGVGVNRYGGVAGGYSYRYRDNPRASLRLEGQQRAQIRTQERIKGNASANAVMQGLDADMANVRRQLTAKYGVEF